MKIKLFIFLLVLSSLQMAFAQINLPKKINWTGVQKFYADSIGTDFVTFDGAKYLFGDRLPYYQLNIQRDSASYYGVLLSDIQFIPLEDHEKELINPASISSSVQVSEKSYRENGKDYLEVTILPLQNIDGKIVKINTFNIVLTKKKQSRINRVINAPKTYTQNSVLSSGKFVKIKVAESGVYKLTYEDLVSMGIDPVNVRIFGYGGAVLNQNLAKIKLDDLPEVAIWMEKGSDGIFNSGDYVLFYAQSAVNWSFNSSSNSFVHQNNPYSNFGYYFVTSDVGEGKKMQNKVVEIPQSANIQSINTFNDYQLHEIDTHHLLTSGKEFLGEVFDNITSYNFSFNFPNMVQSNNAVQVKLNVVNTAFAVGYFQLTMDGNQTYKLQVNGRSQNSNDYVQGIEGIGVYGFTPSSDNLSFALNYQKPDATSTAYLNYLEVNAQRKLTMAGAVMPFSHTSDIISGSFKKYKIAQSNSDIAIWDITDQQNIKVLPTTLEADTLSFTDDGGSLINYIAVNTKAKNSFQSPTIVGPISNQNIHGISQADLVIITHPNFKQAADKLAQIHHEKDNLSVAVVTTDQVYNEFSSGTPDATAYRSLMRMLYDRANSDNDKPKYLQLIGRGSYDNKGTFLTNPDNFILTYQADNFLVTTSSYVTDDYFGMLKDDQGVTVIGDSMNIGVGRLPVTNLKDAMNTVNKIEKYVNNTNKSIWKNQIVFLADDGDGALHMRQADDIAETLSQKYSGFQIDKIYLDAYQQVTTASGQRNPTAKTRFLNLIQSGTFYLNYTGHAGPTGWSNEAILSLNDVKSLANKNMPFVMAATCDFLQFDIPGVSGGEEMLLNPSGGCIGILSASRLVYSYQNRELNKQIATRLFDRSSGNYGRLGDIVSASKNALGADMNKLPYILMGDPALKLTYPTKYNVKTTAINGDQTLTNDTLKALSVATVSGSIVDDNGNTVFNFNGSLDVDIYDKKQLITTLNNDGDQTGSLFTFYDRPNTLFSGRVKITNGTFSFTFLVPRDIMYNFGKGRINYYATSSSNTEDEAQGYYEGFIVGGSNSNFTGEDVGPKADIYLNSTHFVSGDKVNETPVFLAYLFDQSGINMVGSGIGHDIKVTIDQDAEQTYIINEHFKADENTYQSGSIEFKLPQMTDGKHTLTFNVWDLLNNSTTKSIDFVVVTGLAPEIFAITSYPNPASNTTKIKISHDRPETVLSTLIEIFDFTGKKIWSFTETSPDDVAWNLCTSGGQPVQPGLYLCRVTIQTSNSKGFSKTNKIQIVSK